MNDISVLACIGVSISSVRCLNLYRNTGHESIALHERGEDVTSDDTFTETKVSTTLRERNNFIWLSYECIIALYLQVFNIQNISLFQPRYSYKICFEEKDCSIGKKSNGA